MIHIETLLCACMILLTCSQNSPSNLLTIDDQGKLYRCQSQQEFVVELEANPTTGHTWQVIKSDPEHVRLLRQESVPGERERLGAPGKQLFFFHALAIGHKPLTWEYQCAWGREVSITVSIPRIIHV